jgi:hypothetical protein
MIGGNSAGHAGRATGPDPMLARSGMAHAGLAKRCQQYNIGRCARSAHAICCIESNALKQGTPCKDATF